MTHEENLKSFRDATSAPPVGARERVWRALEAPAQPRTLPLWQPVLALAASVLVGVVAVRALTPSPKTDGQFSDENTAVAWTSSIITRTDKHLTLEQGELAVSTWGAPVEVAVRGHVVKVERGVALVRAAGDSISAEVVDGALYLDGVEHKAQRGGAASTSPALSALEPLETPRMRSRRLVQRAEQAVTEQRFTEAVNDLTTVASSGTLDAEVANFKLAELELRRLGRTENALATLEAGEARFPHGALTQERQLSAIESCVKLERWAEVARRVDAFLEAHPDSERAAELQQLRDRARERR